ncbi:MAG: HAD-IA family hydrolase [Phascolarctobacterium sp.]|nr:HAD-IA family hydrolase [Phascolarctobacterium sp.]
MIKGILFDFDGTIADTTEIILTAFAYTVKTCLHRETTREEMLATFGLVIHDAFYMYTHDEAKITEMRNIYRAEHNRLHDEMIKIFPGVRKGIDKLKKQGIRIGIVTSKKSPMLKHGLSCLGLLDYVDVMVCADDVINGKPDPEPMRIAANKLGLFAYECIAVGDSPFDIMSGKRAGMQTFAVNYTDLDKKRFVGEGEPDGWLNSLDELVDIIKNNFIEEVSK